MKVVLFCGGQGLRIRDQAHAVPKPMVRIGVRPVLWHIMKYYAHQGHRDFILCLGYQGDVIKKYFLDYDESVSNDFVLHGSDLRPQLLSRDIEDWSITFVDTGLNTSIGERLRRARPYLGDDPYFLANYSDDLTDAPLDPWIAELESRNDIVGTFMAVNPNLSLHTVSLAEDGRVDGLRSLSSSGILVNGGYFVFRQAVFDYLGESEDLVSDAFPRMIQDRALLGYRYEGFWAALDTFKDLQQLEDMYERGEAPWMIWNCSTDPT